MSRRIPHGVSVVAAAAAFALGAALPRPVSAQDPVAQISAECESEAGPLLQGICRDGALALRALHAGTGLLMTGGGALPASPSTVGRRLPGSPRIIVDLGATWASFSHPVLSYTASGTATEEQSVLAGGRATAVIGVFDGFSAVTGVGGILAVDAVAGARWVRVPDSPVGPGSALGWGGGLRIGVFRESFSLPGVTLSATHDRAGALRYGTEEDPGAWVEIEPAVTSFRAIVGKDLWPVGLSAGIGWDLYRGAGRIEARLAAEGDREEVAATRSHDLSLERRYLFAGLNYTWVVTQVAAEVTWTQAATPASSLEGTGPFRPGDRELQGAFTMRLLY